MQSNCNEQAFYGVKWVTGFLYIQSVLGNLASLQKGVNQKL